MIKVYDINVRQVHLSFSSGCYHFYGEGDNAFSASHEACS